MTEPLIANTPHTPTERDEHIAAALDIAIAATTRSLTAAAESDTPDQRVIAANVLALERIQKANDRIRKNQSSAESDILSDEEYEKLWPKGYHEALRQLDRHQHTDPYITCFCTDCREAHKIAHPASRPDSWMDMLCSLGASHLPDEFFDRGGAPVYIFRQNDEVRIETITGSPLTAAPLVDCTPAYLESQLTPKPDSTPDTDSDTINQMNYDRSHMSHESHRSHVSNPDTDTNPDPDPGQNRTVPPTLFKIPKHHPFAHTLARANPPNTV